MGRPIAYRVPSGRARSVGSRANSRASVVLWRRAPAALCVAGGAARKGLHTRARTELTRRLTIYLYNIYEHVIYFCFFFPLCTVRSPAFAPSLGLFCLSLSRSRAYTHSRVIFFIFPAMSHPVLRAHVSRRNVLFTDLHSAVNERL